MDNRKIGIFDSGVGGITCLNALLSLLPGEDYIYLADLKNSPYGDKDSKQLYEFTKNNIEFLLTKDVKAIVVACNTASSYVIDSFRDEYDLPFITVLEEAVESIDESCNKILLAATKATCEAGKYDQLVGQRYKNVSLSKVACIDVVRNLEEEELSTEDTQDLVDSYIRPFRDKGYKALILGCTHYPLWTEYFSRAIGEDVKIIDPSADTASAVKKRLKEAGLFKSQIGAGLGSLEFYVTDRKEKFSERLEKFLDKKLQKNFKIVKI